jgi:lipopolysaccharide/colanic/teichoic acid biosynthesis glycosyltransferase
MNESFYSRCGKRAFDAFLSSLGLLALSPLFLVCAILIKFSSPGPVFFRQQRTGLEGKPFRIYKFRSMFCRPNTQTSLLTSSGDPRVTPLGHWLRKTKIDELPQLFNVLLGNMSLVGPRPEVTLYTDKYTEEQRRIFSVRPGITGLASVTFSSEEQLLAGQADKEHYYVSTLMPFKVDLDLRYCRRVTLLGDLGLLLQTFLKLFAASKTLMILVRDSSGPSK